ncbi:MULTISPECIES: hypothetical protein [Citrobacter]|uniref:hypothetical protein n=1 Tax=Citrobacter TaxID=544 RepID=UPI0011EF0F2C|nr:hypothetical protein [Citrobacter braakii]
MDKLAIQFARDLRLVFDHTHSELDETGIPFFYSFPKNACQGASVFLGLFFTWLYPGAVICIVKGSHRTKDEHHYWVELNARVYDLTNDQFEPWLGETYQGLNAPVYATKKHPLRNYFFYKKRESAIHAYATFVTGHANLIDVDKAQWFIIDKLREYGWNLVKTPERNRLVNTRQSPAAG